MSQNITSSRSDCLQPERKTDAASHPRLDGGKPYDVCVVGAGPVGLTVALECARHGLSVALLDAGPDAVDTPATTASAATIVDPRRHVPMDLAVRRAFGGTTSLWGGRCVPFNDIDFEQRAYVPDSGWPIAHAELSAWYQTACTYLDCGDAIFEEKIADWPDKTGDMLSERLEHFAKQPKRGLSLRSDVEAHPLIDLVMDSPVVALDLGLAGAAVEGVVVVSGKPRVVRAKRYVLACGGLETTRLLLATRLTWPSLFGGPDGALGRYYAGHFEGTIANIVFDSPASLPKFDYRLDATGGYIRRLLGITDAAQVREHIQNIVFWPDNRPFHDAEHYSGIKSFIYLLMVFPTLGRRLVCEAIRLGIVGQGPAKYLPHLRNVFGSPIRTAQDILDVARDRFISKRRRPGWLPATPRDSYVLHYRSEQRPCAGSRVTLNSDKDEFGLERLSIDLRYTQEDAQSAVRAHDVLDAALRANGKGRLEFLYPKDELAERILDQASDGYHQTGTTRMGTDPASSVVDLNCQVHGLANLSVASTSVFPTSSHANPTFLATAIAARLAAHLARTMGTPVGEPETREQTVVSEFA